MTCDVPLVSAAIVSSRISGLPTPVAARSSDEKPSIFACEEFCRCSKPPVPFASSKIMSSHLLPLDPRPPDGLPIRVIQYWEVSPPLDEKILCPRQCHVLSLQRIVVSCWSRCHASIVLGDPPTISVLANSHSAI